MTDRTELDAHQPHHDDQPVQAHTTMVHANRLLAAFYIGVAGAALVGQTLAAREWLGWPVVAAGAAVLLVELGGIALCAYADARRRLGERALPARALSAAVATGAVLLNWFGHHDHLQGAFFAGLSALGYLVWLINSESRRRDELRAKRRLPPTPPAYELVGHWARHPWITRRARSLAKANPTLGLYGSLTAAEDELRREARNAQLAKALRRRIQQAVDPTMAKIAILTYDLDEIATRLRNRADYDGLTTILTNELSAARIADAANVSLTTSASALTPADADALTSAPPKLTPTSVSPSRQQNVNGKRQPANVSVSPARQPAPADASAPRPSSVSADARPPRQLPGQRVNAATTPASARTTSRTPATRTPTPPTDAGERQNGRVADAPAARQRYRASVDAGNPLTGRELGRLHDRSEAWGRERIREVKQQLAASASLTD